MPNGPSGEDLDAARASLNKAITLFQEETIGSAGLLFMIEAIKVVKDKSFPDITAAVEGARVLFKEKKLTDEHMQALSNTFFIRLSLVQLHQELFGNTELDLTREAMGDLNNVDDLKFAVIKRAVVDIAERIPNSSGEFEELKEKLSICMRIARQAAKSLSELNGFEPSFETYKELLAKKGIDPATATTDLPLEKFADDREALRTVLLYRGKQEIVARYRKISGVQLLDIESDYRHKTFEIQKTFLTVVKKHLVDELVRELSNIPTDKGKVTQAISAIQAYASSAGDEISEQAFKKNIFDIAWGIFPKEVWPNHDEHSLQALREASTYKQRYITASLTKLHQTFFTEGALDVRTKPNIDLSQAEALDNLEVLKQLFLHRAYERMNDILKEQPELDFEEFKQLLEKEVMSAKNNVENFEYLKSQSPTFEEYKELLQLKKIDIRTPIESIIEQLQDDPVALKVVRLYQVKQGIAKEFLAHPDSGFHQRDLWGERKFIAEKERIEREIKVIEHTVQVAKIKLVTELELILKQLYDIKDSQQLAQIAGETGKAIQAISAIKAFEATDKAKQASAQDFKKAIYAIAWEMFPEDLRPKEGGQTAEALKQAIVTQIEHDFWKVYSLKKPENQSSVERSALIKAAHQKLTNLSKDFVSAVTLKAEVDGLMVSLGTELAGLPQKHAQELEKAKEAEQQQVEEAKRKLQEAKNQLVTSLTQELQGLFDIDESLITAQSLAKDKTEKSLAMQAIVDLREYTSSEGGMQASEQDFKTAIYDIAWNIFPLEVRRKDQTLQALREARKYKQTYATASLTALHHSFFGNNNLDLANKPKIELNSIDILDNLDPLKRLFIYQANEHISGILSGQPNIEFAAFKELVERESQVAKNNAENLSYLSGLSPKTADYEALLKRKGIDVQTPIETVIKGLNDDPTALETVRLYQAKQDLARECMQSPWLPKVEVTSKYEQRKEAIHNDIHQMTQTTKSKHTTELTTEPKRLDEIDTPLLIMPTGEALAEGDSNTLAAVSTRVEVDFWRSVERLPVNPETSEVNYPLILAAQKDVQALSETLRPENLGSLVTVNTAVAERVKQLGQELSSAPFLQMLLTFHSPTMPAAQTAVVPRLKGPFQLTEPSVLYPMVQWQPNPGLLAGHWREGPVQREVGTVTPVVKKTESPTASKLSKERLAGELINELRRIYKIDESQPFTENDPVGGAIKAISQYARNAVADDKVTTNAFKQHIYRLAFELFPPEVRPRIDEHITPQALREPICTLVSREFWRKYPIDKQQPDRVPIIQQAHEDIMELSSAFSSKRISKAQLEEAANARMERLDQELESATLTKVKLDACDKLGQRYFINERIALERKELIQKAQQDIMALSNTDSDKLRRAIEARQVVLEQELGRMSIKNMARSIGFVGQTDAADLLKQLENDYKKLNSRKDKQLQGTFKDKAAQLVLDAMLADIRALQTHPFVIKERSLEEIQDLTAALCTLAEHRGLKIGQPKSFAATRSFQAVINQQALELKFHPQVYETRAMDILFADVKAYLDSIGDEAVSQKVEYIRNQPGMNFEKFKQQVNECFWQRPPKELQRFNAMGAHDYLLVKLGETQKMLKDAKLPIRDKAVSAAYSLVQHAIEADMAGRSRTVDEKIELAKACDVLEKHNVPSLRTVFGLPPKPSILPYGHKQSLKDMNAAQKSDTTEYRNGP